MKVYNVTNEIDKYLSSLGNEERTELLQVNRTRITSLVMSELGMDVNSNFMGKVRYPYSALLSENINIEYVRGNNNFVLNSLKVLLQLDVLDFYNQYLSYTSQYDFGFISDCNESALKFLYLDLITGGSYITPLVDAIIKYNSMGVIFNYIFDKRILCGQESLKPRIVIDICRSTIDKNMLVIKSISLLNIINGMDDVIDALSCLSDRFCILNPNMGLGFFSDMYFCGKNKITYGKNKIVPVEFVISDDVYNTFLYKNIIYKNITLSDGVNQYNSYRYLDGLMSDTDLSLKMASEMINIVGYDIGFIEQDCIKSNNSDISIRYT